jgi:hypothetical protein
LANRLQINVVAGCGSRLRRVCKTHHDVKLGASHLHNVGIRGQERSQVSVTVPLRLERSIDLTQQQPELSPGYWSVRELQGDGQQFGFGERL